MSLLQDAIEAQRTQYPYDLPPTPAQESLQSPNIIGDIAQRWVTPLASKFAGPSLGQKLGTYAGQMAPILAMGAFDPEEDIAAARGLTGELRGAVTEPFGPYSVQSNLSPAERAYWRSMRPAGEPLPEVIPAVPRRGPVPETKPLSEMAAQEARYHGSRSPSGINMAVPKEMVSSHGNMVGPGLYTTDNLAIGRGYGEGGHVYQIYEVKPVKMLDSENQPVPLSALKRMRDFLPGRTKMGGVGEAGAWDPYKFQNHRAYDVFELFASQRDDVKQDALIKALQEEGYGGFTHIGGIRSGGERHNVKVYWDINDVRMRPTNQYQINYVRDVPIPGRPGAIKRFRQQFQRVSPPLMGKPWMW